MIVIRWFNFGIDKFRFTYLNINYPGLLNLIFPICRKRGLTFDFIGFWVNGTPVSSKEEESWQF